MLGFEMIGCYSRTIRINAEGISIVDSQPRRPHLRNGKALEDGHSPSCRTTKEAYHSLCV